MAQDFRFNSVTIEGSQRIEPATILSYAGIARGETVSAAELNDAYQRIIGSGLFESAEIVPDGSELVIRVSEFPTVNRIAFEGNRRIDDETLSALVQTQSRRVFNPRIAETDAQTIADAYAQQGRLAARVTPRIIRRSDNRVDLVFEVLEGGIAEIERIGFVGNRAYSDRRLRRVLQTKQAGLLRQLIQRDTFVEDRIAFDRQLLSDFYASRGYVDFRITGVNAELAEARDAYFVTFNIEEGQQFEVGSVTVNTDLADVDPAVFEDALTLREGVTYSPTRVETQIARLERLAVQMGLNFIRVEPRVTRNDRELTLDVAFRITRGERIFVERIDITGNTTTLDRVVRRQFDTVEGDPFNPRAIRQAAERIRALGFFSQADVQAREGSSPEQVVLDVEVTEQPTGSLSFGASYSTTSGIGATASFSERNFLGRGQALRLSVDTASSTTSYGFSFREPAFLGRDVAFGIEVSYRDTSSLGADYNTERGVFQPSLGFPINDAARAEVRYGLTYSRLSSGSQNVGGVIRSEIAEGERWDSSVGYTLSYDTRRTGLNPLAGLLLEAGQDFSGLGGDTSFVTTRVRAEAQTAVLAEEVTLRASVEAAALSYSEGNSRAIDRFVLGPNTIRGFEYAGIGPRELGGAVDDPLGGEMFAVARLEAEFPLGLPEEYGISGGVFYDVGSVWGLSDQTRANVGGTSQIVGDEFSARHVIGFSVFWDTALGPLRLNFSEALVKESFDDDQNFNLTVSTRF